MPRTLTERFWTKVQTGSPLDCWEWTAAKTSTGYGVLGEWRGGKTKMLRAHRIAWFLAYGEWPSGVVCHRCDNKTCVNPLHLFVGTQRDNVRDMARKGRGHNPRLRLTPDQVEAIRADAQTMKQRDVASKHGVSQSCVSRIVNGVRRAS